MQMPVTSTPISRCESLAQYVISAIRRYVVLFAPPPDVVAQLYATADMLESSIGLLSTRQAGYRTLVLACIGPRVEVQLVDLKADETVRSSKRAADDKSKSVAATVFPEGITPIVKPVGQAEVDRLRELEGRMLAAVSHWPEATGWQARIQEVRGQYESALSSRDNALSAASHARALRNAAKEDFLNRYASASGTIKTLFPRDRAVQDIFFDELRKSGGDDAEVEADA